MTESYIGEKEKWTNKGKDKKEKADSLLHTTTSHTQQIKILCKSVYMHIVTEKTKISLYTSYAGGIMILNSVSYPQSQPR